MNAGAANLNSGLLEELELAQKGCALLGAAGTPVALWETCCLAHSNRLLLLRAVDQLSQNGRGAVIDPEILEQLRVIRDQTGLTLKKLDPFLDAPSPDEEGQARREWLLAFFAVSPPALEAVSRWASEPEKYGQEASKRIRLSGGIAERYREALRAAPAEAPVRSGAPPFGTEGTAPPVKTVAVSTPAAELSPSPVSPAVEPASATPAAAEPASRETPPSVAPAPPTGSAGAATPVPPPAVEAAPVASPGIPTGLLATPANGRVALSWTPEPGAIHYVVERAEAAAGPYTQRVRVAETAFTDTAVTNGTTYFYGVRAAHASGESGPSAPVETAPVAPPLPPAGLTAVSGNLHVMLSWAGSSGATKYRLTRSPEPGGPYTQVSEATETTFLDKGVTNGTTYYYAVLALNAGGESDRSSRVHAKPIEPPSAPGALRAVASKGQVKVTWSASERAVRYRVRRATLRAGPYAKVAAVAETAYTDTDVRGGRTYYYIITAVNPGGRSPHVGPVHASPIAPPAAPAAPIAMRGDRRVELAWTAVPGATSYKVVRSEAPGGSTVIAAVTTGTSYMDSPLVNGRSYAYDIRAVGAGGEGAPSPETRATPSEPPRAPSGVEASPGDGRVSLKWDPVERADSYTVKRSALPGGPFMPVGQSVHPGYTDVGLTNGTPHYYSVSARIGSAESPNSAAVSGSPGTALARSPYETAFPEMGRSVGLDPERLLTLMSAERLLQILAENSQKLDPWEVICLVAQGGYAVRVQIEELASLRDKGDYVRMNEGALALFVRIRQVRAELGALIRRLQGLVDLLNLSAFGTKAREITLGFLASTPAGCQRAELWLANLDLHQEEARAYLEQALGVSLRYLSALAGR